MNISISIPASPLSGTVAIGATISGSNANQATRCELFVDGVAKGTDTSIPYSFSLDTTTIQDGSHQFRVRVHYGRNKFQQEQVTREIRNLVVPPPPPPPVPPPGPTVISNIVSGQSVPIGTMWQVTVTPTPTKVEFWADGTLLAEDQMEPFGTPINLTAGTHDLGLVATVNGVPTVFGTGGVFADNIVVTAAPAPPPSPPAPPAYTSSITDGATVARGTTWTVTTSPDSSLVEFWANGVQLGTDTSEPYTHVLNLAAGTHQIGICATVDTYRHCFGGAIGMITVTDTAPPPPPPTSFGVPAYRVTEPQGGGFHSHFVVHDSSRRQIVGDGINPDKHAILMWSTAGGGPGPALYSGKRLYALIGYRLITGWPYRAFDGHNQPNDSPHGWGTPTTGVSPFCVDLAPNTERGVTYTVEPMYPNHWYRILSPAEAETRRGQWVWIWIELGIGRRDSLPAGSCRAWVAGEDAARFSVTNIDTHWADQHQWTWWDGAYNSSGFPTACTFEFAATRFGRTPQECYEDRPVYYADWANGTGSTFTAISDRSSTEAAVPVELRW